MDPLADLPGGWEVWNAEPGGRAVLAFRPDVFDGDAFPPACLPTLTVGPGRSPDGRPDRTATSGHWHVALYLEPDVRVREVDEGFEDRDAAVAAAAEAARAFAAGELDLRSAYQEPREGYLDRLEALIGTDD